MLRVFPRNSDALETISMSGPFSKLTNTPWDNDENWTGYRCPADEAVCVQHPM
jgi:hypothetical protein